jgi:hypothetical protein
MMSIACVRKSVDTVFGRQSRVYFKAEFALNTGNTCGKFIM